MRNFNQFLNEIKIGKWQFDMKKHMFKEGDICTLVKDYDYSDFVKEYKSSTKMLVGERCVIKSAGYLSGDSLFPKIISDFFYYRNINFGREKIKSYNVEFLDVYVSGRGEEESYTKDLNKAASLPERGNLKAFLSVFEYQLKLDEEYMIKRKKEIEELNDKMMDIDPYSEEDWSEI